MSAILSSLERATIDATPDFFASGSPADDVGNEDEFEYESDDLEPMIGAFDDDELWREVARTGRAL